MKRCGDCDHLVEGEHGRDGQCLIDYPWKCHCPGLRVELIYDDEADGGRADYTRLGRPRV